ncbi:MAG: beta-galactosidase [Clostridiales bacterium]|jgi:beta-galactosidase|nr:beta-galactosidase [Clostridiales bacterium]
MKWFNIDRSWEFMFGEPSAIPGMNKEKREVHLPHDFMIESDVRGDSVNGPNTGFYDGGTATYTKFIDAPEQWSDKRFLINLDGAFRDTSVILNGHLIGRHHYGYTPFVVDLTPQLKLCARNRLSIVVSNDAEPNSRWYPGSGIYRHVNLLVAEKVHIAPYGIFASTSHIVNDDAFIVVETTIENHTSEDVDKWVNIELYPAVADISCRAGDIEGEAVASGMVKVHVPAGGHAVARTQIAVKQAAIWDIDNPNLYQIKAELISKRPTDNTDYIVFDEAKTIFGIRKISVDARNGFMLNGRSINLKGGCIHHDNGILGAASYYDSEYRKVKLHKENGYNALRFAHNPMSADMLEACDRLGILVINEAFDTWNMPKNRHDFCRHFENDWENELTSLIMRDRNHPSVIIWSIGNELPEQGGLSDGYNTSAKLAAYVRSLDHTRLVAGALCSFFNGLDDEDNEKFWNSLMKEAQMNGGVLNNLDSEFGREIWSDYTECFAAPWDVVGYNYLNYQYKKSSELFPDRVICCTESKPRDMLNYWQDVENNPQIIGDFEWTSHDYIGEAGIGKRLYVEPGREKDAARSLHAAKFPWRTAGAGEFDLCGFGKPQLAYRRIVWGSQETFIACHNPANFNKVEILDRYSWSDCANSWSWPAASGSDIKVEVYSSAEEVELIINGRSIGSKPAGKNNKYKALFEVSYEPGEITAIGYNSGQEVSRDSLKTAGRAAKIKISPDPIARSCQNTKADGQSLFFAVVEIVDEFGNYIPYAEVELIASVEKLNTDQNAGGGTTELVAFGTGRGMTEENYTVGKITAYEGRALAIIRSGDKPEQVKLSISSADLETGEIEIRFE